MTSNLDNPYTGRTLRVARPTADNPAFRLLAESDLSQAQAHWDLAEVARRAEAASEAVRTELLARYETIEEPAAKAFENRMRIAFLSTKGATMKMWLEQRDGIMADLLRSGAGDD